jgi:hypothetical protein
MGGWYLIWRHFLLLIQHVSVRVTNYFVYISAELIRFKGFKCKYS